MAKFTVTKRGNGDFPDVYFPLKFSEVIDTFNKDSLLKTINSVDRPHRYLFEGMRGTGKTTTARVLSLWLNCTNKKGDEACLKCQSCQAIIKGTPDIIDINVAESRNIDDAREIIENAQFYPMILKYKVFILDEVQQMNSLAQNALLKNMEKKHTSVFYMLCTTDSGKIIKTLRDRCTAKFTFRGLTEEQKVDLMVEVLKNENFKYNLNDIEKISENVNNSVRNVLASLQNYINGNLSVENIENDENWIKDLAGAIMKGDSSFLLKLKDIPQLSRDGNVEGFRIGIASYFKACLINNETRKGKEYEENRAKFAKALDALTENYYGGDAMNRLTLNLYKASSYFRKS